MKLQGNFSRQLTEFQQLYDQEKDKAIPKKKFAFARKKPAPKQEAKPVVAEEPKTAEESKPAFTLDYSGNHLLIKDLKQQSIQRTESEYAGKENLILENLEQCTVILPFAVKCIYMKHVTDCKIYVGANSGATFVDYAINSMIFIQSHQIRIHNSKNTQFYLTAKSNPIIEHCTQMGFGPFLLDD